MDENTINRLKELAMCPYCNKPMRYNSLLPCGHRFHYLCLEAHIKQKKARRCPTCTKLFRPKPNDLPTDVVFNEISAILFDAELKEQPCTIEESNKALAASIRSRMESITDKIAKKDEYFKLLERELLPENIHNIVECRCDPPLVCVLRRKSRPGDVEHLYVPKFYYGCPAWKGKGTGCNAFRWVKLDKSDPALQDPKLIPTASSASSSSTNTNSSSSTQSSIISLPLQFTRKKRKIEEEEEE